MPSTAKAPKLWPAVPVQVEGDVGGDVCVGAQQGDLAGEAGADRAVAVGDRGADGEGLAAGR